MLVLAVGFEVLVRVMRKSAICLLKGAELWPHAKFTWHLCFSPKPVSKIIKDWVKEIHVA